MKFGSGDLVTKSVVPKREFWNIQWSQIDKRSEELSGCIARRKPNGIHKNVLAGGPRRVVVARACLGRIKWGWTNKHG